MKRIYISGPMKGIEGLNRAEFRKAAYALVGQHEELVDVINPHDVAGMEGWDQETSIKEIASVLVSWLVGCDAIYMLRGWEQSKGARAEHAVAVWVGLEIMYQGGEG